MMRLTEHARGYMDETIFVLLAALAACVLLALAADCAGVRAVWWTDALLCGAVGAVGILLFIGSKLD